MDMYKLSVAIDDANEALNCELLSTDFRGTVGTLLEAATKLQELNENPADFDSLKVTLTELREEVESAQGTLSDLDDKFADIYSKLDDADCALDELEG